MGGGGKEKIIKCVKDPFTPAPEINPQQQMIDNLSCRRDWNQFYSLFTRWVVVLPLLLLLSPPHLSPSTIEHPVWYNQSASLPEGATDIHIHPPRR